MDKTIAKLLTQEEIRQQTSLELIPSENYTSKAVRDLMGSILTNKYSEGYPNKRYYGGNEIIDEIENLAIERAKSLFGVPFANVQAYSGSPANFAVLMATCSPGDAILGQSLSMGGHLTHGHAVSASGIFFDSYQYSLKKFTKSGEDMIDYEELEMLAKKYNPKIIWVGTSAYPLTLHYEKFAKIADSVGAFLVADISHIAGLIVGNLHPSPVDHAHIITTTTHKTLRGPRGAIIMATQKGLDKDEMLGAKINKAIFPGLQGGPHNHQTAAIAQALFEASTDKYAKYIFQVKKNAEVMADQLSKLGYNLVGGTTQNHLILIDLSQTHGQSMGIIAEKALDTVGLTINKNSVPFDESSPFYPSGIRLGTPALTTRGMKEKEVIEIVEILHLVLESIKAYPLPHSKEEKIVFLKNFEIEFSKKVKNIQNLKKQVSDLCNRFPLP